MEPKEKKAFEPSGLVPRSIVRTFERFRQQLLPGSETAAIREYRISRYQVLVSARCLFTLLTIPIVTNWLVSSWILSPLIEHFWNTQQNEIFLNSYQEEHAFAELEFFSEKIFFESLLNKMGTLTIPTRLSIWESSYMPEYTPKGTPLYLVSYVPGMLADPSACEAADSYPRGEAQLRSRQPKYGSQVIPLKSTSTSDFRLRHPTFGLRNREERSQAALPASFSTELATYAYPSGKQGEGVQLPFGYAKQPVLLPLYPLGLTDPKGMQRGKVCRQAPDAPIPICFASPTGYRACEAEGQGMQHFSAVEKRRRSQAEEKIIVTYEDNVKDNGYSYNDPTSMLRFSFAPMLRRPLFSPNYGCFLLCKPVGAKQETLTQSVYKKVRVYSLAILQADNNQEQANENLGIRRTSCCILYPEGASYYPSPLYPLAKRGASYDPFGVRYAEGMGASEAGYACSASLSLDAEGHPTFEYPRFAKGQKAYPSGTEGMQAEVASSGGSGTDGYAREVLLSFLLRQPKENCYVPFCLASSSGCFAYIPEGLVSIPNPEGVVGCRRSTRINSIDAKFVQNNSSGTLILSEAQKLTVPGSFVDTYGLQNVALLDQKPQTNSLELEIDSVKIKEKVQEKILELAIYYNQQTILSITNIVGDLVSIFTLGCLFIWMKPEIAILKSFLIEAIYSLSDTTKSFLLILLTDLLVGFHSPRGWETALELLLKHFGLPENQDFVFLFVATFPVLLDTVFKYWIFRHLNKISPSTVATYHSMIE